MMNLFPFRLTGSARKGVLACAVLLGTMLPAHAQCLPRQEARAIVESGQVLAPGQIASLVRGHGAKLVALELCRAGSGYVYVLRVVTRRGQVREISVDAYSGNLGGALE